jgi:hypothetical protein
MKKPYNITKSNENQLFFTSIYFINIFHIYLIIKNIIFAIIIYISKV